MSKRLSCLAAVLSFVVFTGIGSRFDSLANGQKPIVTRWMHPLGLPKPLHVPLEIYELLRLRRVPELSLQRLQEQALDRGRICIVVHQSVYNDILPGLLQYQSDLTSSGFSVVTYEYITGPPRRSSSLLI